MEIKIRRMTPADAARAAEIEAVCFTEPWSERAYHATLLLPYAHYFAAEVTENGERVMIGTCGLQIMGGDGEISNVAVLPRYRGQGIAHQLMDHVLIECDGEVTGDYTLEVRESNTAARALYEHFGFVTEGVRKNFYTKPSENALIMWKRRNG